MTPGTVDNQNLKTRIVKGAVWSFIDNIAAQALTFAVFLVLARLLSPVVFGLLAISSGFIQLFKSAICDSIATAIVSLPEPKEKDYTTGFWLVAGSCVVGFVILLAGAGQIAALFHQNELKSVLYASSFLLLFSGLSRIHEAWLTRQLQFQSLAIRSSISVSLGGIFGIILAFRGWGVYSLVGQQILQSLVSLVVLWRVTNWRPTLIFDRESAGKILRYSRHVGVTALTNFGNQNSDVFFIAYFLGPAASGTYAAAKRILAALNAIIGGALLRVALPAFAQVQNDQARLKRAYLEATALTATVTAPLFMGVGFLAPDLIHITLGKGWEAAIPIMSILAVTGFVQSIGYYNHSIMLALNKPHWQTNLTLLYALTNIISFLFLTRYGLSVVAIAFTARMLLFYPLSAGFSGRLIDLSPSAYIASCLPQIGSSLIMGAAIILAKHYLPISAPVLRLLVLSLLGLVTYLGVMKIFGSRHLDRGSKLVTGFFSKVSA